jgi:hypothetical protein
MIIRRLGQRPGTRTYKQLTPLPEPSTLLYLTGDVAFPQNPLVCLIVVTNRR